MTLNKRNEYRTVKTPGGYLAEPPGRAVEWNKIYIGKVKANVDKGRMGRLKVFIPELCPKEPYDIKNARDKEKDESNWILVSYASIFAGSTNITTAGNENTYENAERSYGFWAAPPDKDVQVAVFFANGDPSRGFWFSCIFNEQMNQSVPGIGSDNTDISADNHVPKTEANRKAVATNQEKPERSEYKPLADGLRTQGLITDNLRGTGFSSARRVGDFGTSNTDEDTHAYKPSKVYGMLTPGGHQFVMDDGFQNSKGENESKLIRFRTTHGSQILIDDTAGLIYFITKDGKTWMEITDRGGGNVDVYSAANISVHAEEGDINLTAGNNIVMKAGQSIYMQAGDDIISNAVDSIQTKSGGITTIEAEANMNLKTSAQMNQQSDTTFNVLAGGNYYETASNIHMNGPTASSSATAATALDPKITPQHEPWDVHTHRFTATTSTTGGKIKPESTTLPAPLASPPAETGKEYAVDPDTLPDVTPYDGTLPGTICGLNEDETRAYLGTLGKRESSNNYTAVNRYGYLGKYQFGTLALKDAGYIKMSAPNSNSALNDPNNWLGTNGATSKEAFLANQNAQEAAIVAFSNRNCKYLQTGSNRIPNFSLLPSDQKAGYLMAAHLTGHGPAKDLYRGLVEQDGNGVTNKSYYDLGVNTIRNI